MQEAVGNRSRAVVLGRGCNGLSRPCAKVSGWTTRTFSIRGVDAEQDPTGLVRNGGPKGSKFHAQSLFRLSFVSPQDWIGDGLGPNNPPIPPGARELCVKVGNT